MSDPTPDPQDVLKQIRMIEELARSNPRPSPDLRRLSASLLDLSRWMLTTNGEASAITTAADRLEALVEDIEATNPGPSRFTLPLPEEPQERYINERSTHPLVGVTNPASPGIAVRVEDGRILGDVTFDARFEGNVGWVHGGFVAAGFDIISVLACRLSGRGGPTGTLSVRYQSPTPIGVPLRYEGDFLRAEGRKLFAEGRLMRLDDETVTARSEAIIIALA
ncbi:PaaI family thioesterase [Myxococcota bacterium]|nr:PaaI family thioesterase [Myxococcota bacterium]